MNAQRRRLCADTGANTLIGDSNSDICSLDLDESASVNVHGLRVCGSIEPENTDANANGFWVVYCLPSNIISESTQLAETFGDLNAENLNPYIWGVGCWTASNQAPYHFEFAPRTSRTCQKDARIVCSIVKTGISAGAVRINQTLTCFTNN